MRRLGRSAQTALAFCYKAERKKMTGTWDQGISLSPSLVPPFLLPRLLLSLHDIEALFTSFTILMCSLLAL